MDLKRLNHFVALAEEGRFSLGAKRVHLSQAAYSRSIQTLEQQLGLRLFDRGAQGAGITPAGAIVLARARALIFEASCLERDLALLKHGDLGEIVIGAAPIPASVIVPELLSRLRRESPQLMVRVRMGNLPNLLEQLEAQQIDFCLGDPRLVPANPRYAMTSMGKHSGGLYCRRTHKLARKGEADSAAMSRYGVALISMSSAMRSVLAADFGFKALAGFPQVVECDDVHTLVRLVMDSDVLGFLPHSVVAQSAQKLRRLQVPGAHDAHADVHAIWLKGRTLAPAADKAVQLARDISMQLIRAYKESSRRSTGIN